jgi:hypothetical protein
MVVAVDHTTVNGKSYKKGDEVMEVQITEQEAKVLNEQPSITGCKYELIEEDKAPKVTKEPKEEKAPKQLELKQN